MSSPGIGTARTIVITLRSTLVCVVQHLYSELVSPGRTGWYCTDSQVVSDLAI
jgi:hypothetical protein